MISVVGGPCDGQQVHPIPEHGSAERRPVAGCWICQPTPPGRLWPGPYFPYHFDADRYVWTGQTSGANHTRGTT